MQFLDVGSDMSLSGTPLYITRGDTSFVFNPSNTYLQYQNTGLNVRLININGTAFGY